MTVTINPLMVSGSRQERRQHADGGADHGAGDAADRARDDEGQAVHAPNGDAAQLRRGRLLRHGARREPELGPVEQRDEQHHGHAAETEHEDEIAAQVERADRYDHVGVERRVRDGDARRLMHDDLVDQEQGADGGHEGGEGVGLGDKAEADEIDDKTDGAARNAGEEEDENCRRLDAREDEQTGIGGADGRCGVRQIDLVHDAEDHREADADERVGGAIQHAVDDRLHEIDEVEIVHAAPRGQPAQRMGRALFR